MSENQVAENNEQVTGQESNEAEGSPPKEAPANVPSAVEQRALEMGWRPKEEFEGDEEDFIDAQEFVRRKPLFEKIEHVGKELKETRKALKALQEHHQKVKEAEYQKALQALKAEKKAALEEGDADALIEIDERLASVKAEEVAQRAEQRQAAQQPHPNFVAWVQKNQWYQSDVELRSVADQIGTAYAVKNPEVAPDDVLKYVEQRIKKLYPENFRNPNRERPSAVEGRTSTPATEKKDSVSDYPLTDDERRVMNTFVRQGIMTKEEYIKDLKAVKGE
jgi:type II secretory pathway component PulM